MGYRGYLPTCYNDGTLGFGKIWSGAGVYRCWVRGPPGQPYGQATGVPSPTPPPWYGRCGRGCEGHERAESP